MAPAEATTLSELFAATVAEYETEPALRTPDGTVAWTWGEYGRAACAAAAGLAALGVERGSVVACWLTNRPEFHAADTGAALLGAASFSIYPTYTVEQAAHVVGDAGSTVLVTEPAFLERALAVRASGATALQTIVCVGGEHDATVGWNELLSEATDGADLRQLAKTATADDLLTIIYTSGTTGPPKGVELTHANVLAQLWATSAGLGLSERMRAVSYLPMAHIAERLVTHYLAIAHGWRVTTCPDARAIGALLPDVRPEVFFTPPRMWEKLRASALAQFDGDLPRTVAAKDAVLARFGLDAVRVGIVGAAPCPPQVIEFWHALGISVCEVYGLSETTGLATVNRPDAIRVGTVGTALPGVDVRLSDAGEVLVRGPVIMSAYRHLQDATAEAIDSDGWLHTGDLGTFDDDGYLKIVDRIKELIISAAGKNMSPTNIEATLKSASPLIGVPVCIGDGRPYNTALITLDPVVADGRSGDDPDLVSAVQSAVDAANEQLARVEQIKRFSVIDGEWHPDGDELTPTSKLKRRAIAAKYAAEIEAMYAPTA
jgi:long-subunit acyl-CoA synthetase (AMP-forming)